MTHSGAWSVATNVTLINDHIAVVRRLKSVIMPRTGGGITHNAVALWRRNICRQLSRVRITFVAATPMPDYIKLVGIAFSCICDESRPMSVAAGGHELRGDLLPGWILVESSVDVDLGGPWRPHPEGCSSVHQDRPHS